MREFRSTLRARSYELDSFGHVNHAVALNYLEQARFDALAEGGFPAEEMLRRKWAVHVVRVEVDYRREIRMGDALEIVTCVERVGRSSMTLAQSIVRAADGDTVVDARVVAVWIDPDGRPMRVPEDAIRSLVGPDATR